MFPSLLHGSRCDSSLAPGYWDKTGKRLSGARGLEGEVLG